MGKYMKKTKPKSEITLADSTTTYLGVRTRAKTLALQKSNPQNHDLSLSVDSYLQLRSRRLHKPPIAQQSMEKYMKKTKPKSEKTLVDSTTTYLGVLTRAKTLALQKSNPQNRDISLSADSYLQLRSRRLHKSPIAQHSIKKKKNKPRIQNPKSPNGDCGSEDKFVQESPDVKDASSAENVLSLEDRDRNTRETTPVHLIMVPNIDKPPSSTTKRTFPSKARRGPEQASRSTIMSTKEFDEFYAKHEAAQQKAFMEKYNFDPVTETPLPGRYEWEKLTP